MKLSSIFPESGHCATSGQTFSLWRPSLVLGRRGSMGVSAIAVLY